MRVDYRAILRDVVLVAGLVAVAVLLVGASVFGTY